MVLRMDCFPDQVVQKNPYEQTDVSYNWGQNAKVHTGTFVGCISPSSNKLKQRTTANKEIYPIVIQILQGQSYKDVCNWLAKKLSLAHHVRKSTKSLVELGGKAHYNRTGNEVAKTAQARLIAAAFSKGVASSTGWSAEEELQLLWQIQSGVYKDTGGSAEFSGGQSKGMMVLRPFKVYAETDGNLGQTPIWSTGVTMADARLLSTVLLETLIPLIRIRVENALRSFPEEQKIERGDKRTRSRAVSSAQRDLNAGESASKKARTSVNKVGQGTGARQEEVTRQPGKRAQTRAASAKHAPEEQKATIKPGRIHVQVALVKTLREMLEDRALRTDGKKAALVKRLVAHHKSNGETGNDLLFMKAPKIRKPRNQPVLLDLTQDGQPGEETHVTQHEVPANAGKVMQTTLPHGTVQAPCDDRDVGIAGAQDQALGLTTADVQKAIHEAVQKGVHEATKRSEQQMSQPKLHLLHMGHVH